MDKKILKSLYHGELDLNGFKISCAVLEDGTRVLVNRSLANVLGVKGSGAYWRRKQKSEGALLPEYLSAGYFSPYISDELYVSVSNPIPYINNNNIETEGIPAVLLVDICDVYIKAGEKGAFTDNQDFADRAYKILLAFSKIGIIALVDEATGYQYEREKFALNAILKTLVSDEILKYQSQFQLSFYREMFRLWGIPFTEYYIRHKPSFVGHLTNRYIYSNLPAGTLVLGELKKRTPRTPSGNYKYKLHQSLTKDDGIEALKKVLYTVETLAFMAKDKSDFDRLINERYGQKTIPFPEFDSFSKENTTVQKLSKFDQSLKTALNYNPKDDEKE